MDLRTITKNYAADSKIGSLRKNDFRAVLTHESNSTAWELKYINIRIIRTYILAIISRKAFENLLVDSLSRFSKFERAL